MTDPVKNLQQRKNHLQGWLTDFKSARKVVPYVKESLGEVEWQIQTLQSRPANVSDYPAGLADLSEQVTNHIAERLPLIPPHDYSAIFGSTGLSTSETNTTATWVMTHSGSNDASVREWARQSAEGHRQLQESQNRVENIRVLLQQRHDQNLSDRFERAYVAYCQAESGAGDRTAAAILVRTFIDGLKGHLFQSARQNAREKPTWQTAAQNVAADQVERTAITNAGQIHQGLVADLSTIGKDRESATTLHFKDIWSVALNHAYFILRLLAARCQTP